MRDSAEKKEYFAALKKRTLEIQKTIINLNFDVEDNRNIQEIENKILEGYEPRIFYGRKSAEIMNIRSHHDTATVIHSELGADYKNLTVLEFYQKLNYLQELNKKRKKNK